MDLSWRLLMLLCQSRIWCARAAEKMYYQDRFAKVTSATGTSVRNSGSCALASTHIHFGHLSFEKKNGS